MFASESLRETNPLSRTSSASSVSSIDTQTSSDDVSRDSDTPRRTRKRFTSAQLMALEHLFHQTSHPTREQREVLSRDAGIELRSVTVWFQNKRQTERKIALSNTPNDNIVLSDASTPFPSMTSITRPRRQSSVSTVSPPLSASPSLSSISSTSMRTVRSHATRPQLSSHRRPSLDHIASRSERPIHGLRTPTRVRTQSSPNQPGKLYENMPSSPLSPSSPVGNRDREYVDFGMRKKSKSKPTLEWACAAARMSGKRLLEDDDIEPMVLDVSGDTEDEGEIHEAITPRSSAGRDSKIWKSKKSKADHHSSEHLLATPKANLPAKSTQQTRVQPSVPDSDVMDAALALCGLGASFGTRE
ncbi:homeobox-domain-containing protein [Trametopsis cervina]|nr:homeobox-domain-containing protein [Trametopsis cervina]